MAVSTVDYLHAIKFGSSATFTQLADAGHSRGLSEVLERSAGETNPLFRTIAAARPSFSFTTHEIAKLLAFMGQYGTGAAANCDLEVKRAVNLGRRVAAATTSHARYRIAQYLAFWSELRWSHQGNATASVTVTPIWDGSNAPVVPTGDVALGATAGFTELFTGGPIFVNGDQVFGCQSSTLRSGVQLDLAGGESEIWDSFGCVQTTDVVIDVETLDTPFVRSIGTEGVAISSFSWYLRKKAPVTGNVADGTSSHIKITATSGAIYPAELRGADGRVTDGLRIAITDPGGGGNPITISTASSITS